MERILFEDKIDTSIRGAQKLGLKWYCFVHKRNHSKSMGHCKYLALRRLGLRRGWTENYLGVNSFVVYPFREIIEPWFRRHIKVDVSNGVFVREDKIDDAKAELCGVLADIGARVQRVHDSTREMLLKQGFSYVIGAGTPYSLAYRASCTQKRLCGLSRTWLKVLLDATPSARTLIRYHPDMVCRVVDAIAFRKVTENDAKRLDDYIGYLDDFDEYGYAKRD